MQIDKIKLRNLKPAEYNPRMINETQKKRLEESMERFGVVDPIIINTKNRRIIGGHQRFAILQEQHKKNKDYELNLLRLGDIGWVFPDEELTIEDEDYEKALNLNLNKTNASWDVNKLDNLFNDLILNDFELEATGFEISEIKAFTSLQLDEEDEEDEEEDYGSILDELEEQTLKNSHEVFYLVKGDTWQVNGVLINIQNDEFKDRYAIIMEGETIKIQASSYEDPTQLIDKVRKDNWENKGLNPNFKK